jgi:hypothetical protein
MGKYEHSFEIPETERVYFRLRNTGTDEMVKKESHALNMMNSGLILQNEAREFIGRDPLSEEQMRETSEYRKKKYMDELDVEKQKVVSEISTESQIKIAKSAPKKPSGMTKKTSSGNTKSKNTKSEGAKKSAASKVAPKNQHTKDSVVESLQRSILNKESINRVSSKATKLLLDYSMSRLTFGIADSSDYLDEDLEFEVIKATSEMCDEVLISSHDSVRIHTIINKTIDKLDVYVNNIITGQE